MKYIFFLLVLFASCKTTKHLVSSKTDTTRLVKKDTIAKQRRDSVNVNEHEKTVHEVIDTLVQPKAIDTKSSIDINKLKKKTTEGKADTAALYDSLGNLLGFISSILDTTRNVLKQTTHLTPPPIPVHKDVTTSEKSKDSTAVTNNTLTAAKTEDSTNIKQSNVKEDKSSKVSVIGIFAAFWWIPATLICIIILWANKTKLIAWFKKILKIQ